MLDYSSDDPETIANQMRLSMAETVTGMVARSVRNTSLNGVEVRENEYMGFTDHTMMVCTPDKVSTVCALTEKLGIAEKEFFIAVYGKGATEEEKDGLRKFSAEKYPNVELYEIDGGQDVYDFMLIVE